MVKPIRSPKLWEIFKSGKLNTFSSATNISTSENANVVYMVKSGFVKRQMISSDGTYRVMIIYGPQDIFSLTNIYYLLTGQSLYVGDEVYYYETLSEAEIYILPIDKLVDAIKSDSSLYQEMFYEMGHHLKPSIKTIENNGLTSVAARLAHQLVYLAHEFGRSVKNGTEIQVPLTQQDLADILSVARETVARAIVRLRSKGLITNDNQHFIVTDVTKLAEFAYK